MRWMKKKKKRQDYIECKRRQEREEGWKKREKRASSWYARKRRKYCEQLHLWHMVILPSSINIHFTRALAPIIRLQIWFIKKNYHHFVCSSVSHTHARTLTWKRTRKTAVECKAEHNWYRFMLTARELPNLWNVPGSFYRIIYLLRTNSMLFMVTVQEMGEGEMVNGTYCLVKFIEFVTMRKLNGENGKESERRITRPKLKEFSV